MSFNFIIKLLIGIIGVGFTLWSLHGEPVHAAGPTKPGVLTSGSQDVAKVDTAVQKGINYILYFAYAAGAITLAIGVLLLTPIIGKTEEGQKALKGGALVIILAGFFHLLLSMLGSMLA